MAKVRIIANTRLNGAYYGRGSVVDVSEKDAALVASLGIGEVISQPVEPVRVELPTVAEEPPKAKAPKARKVSKK